MTAYSYLLLTVDMLALAALFLGFAGFAKEERYERLFPLLSLVIMQTLALIVSLTRISQAQEIISTLQILSALCLIWALVGPTIHLPTRPREMMIIGGVLAVFLSLLPLIPGWPVPWQIHSLIVVMAGALLIFYTHGQARWTHLAPPLILGLVNILTLPDIGLFNVSWLLTLLAYAIFIMAVHLDCSQADQETIQYLRDRETEAEQLVLDVADQNRERQRLLESYLLLGNVPGLSHAMEHLVSSMAQIIRADQAAIFILDVKSMGLAHLVSVYSPEKPFHITSRDDVVFELDRVAPLQQVVETQQQRLLSAENSGDARQVYSLWNENRTGPTLIQPLAVQGRPVGALLLGNPVSRDEISPEDAKLCRELAPQIGIMLEYRRRYLELELEAEAMAAQVQQQLSQPVREAVPTPAWLEEPVFEDILQPAGVFEPEPAYQVILQPEPAPIPVEVTIPPLEPYTAELTPVIEQYAAVIENIGEGVVLSDTTGRVRLVNKAAERILGRSRENLIDQPIGMVYGQIDSSESIESLAVAFSRRNQPLPTFIEDDERSIQGRLIPWRNEQNEWMGIIGVFRDITREVKADEARNDFVAGLSNELRSPLTMIKGYSELIASSRMGDYTPEQVRIQKIIFSNAERMVEVLDNAIKLTVTDKHRFVVKFEEVNVTKVIGEALREIRPLVEVRKLELVHEISPDLPHIEADRRHLLRILDNLLSNACRFAPRGGRVALRAWVQTEPQGAMAGEHLLIAVSDNGVGIPQREIEKIFLPFYQVKGQKLDEKPGLGIGLAVVKELVDLHNGEIRVESTEGVGSMFQVALPISQEF
jgi:two-component system phosphate regulon sensor histidine kinase PhoR